MHWVHTACFPASQHTSQHIQCWKSYAVTYGLALLKMGIMMPETCWASGLLINHSFLHLAGLTRHFIVRMHGHTNMKHWMHFRRSQAAIMFFCTQKWRKDVTSLKQIKYHWHYLREKKTKVQLKLRRNISEINYITNFWLHLFIHCITNVHNIQNAVSCKLLNSTCVC